MDEPKLLDTAGLKTYINTQLSAEAVPADLKDVFCKSWPAAKQVLQVLQRILKDPITKAIIGIVIEAGDALSGAICK